MANYRQLKSLVDKHILEPEQAQTFIDRFNNPDGYGDAAIAERYYGFRAEAKRQELSNSAIVIAILVALLASVITATTSHSPFTIVTLIVAYLASLAFIGLTYYNSHNAYVALLRHWAAEEKNQGCLPIIKETAS